MKAFAQRFVSQVSGSKFVKKGFEGALLPYGKSAPVKVPLETTPASLAEWHAMRVLQAQDWHQLQLHRYLYQ